MKIERLHHLDILRARQAYQEGRNVTEFLRAQLGVQENVPEVIEVAYDLQAGTYIDHVEKNRPQAERYAAEVAGMLQRHLASADTLLDIGTGELTTLSLVTQHLGVQPSHLYAFDISLSRILVGREFARRTMPDWARLTAFVGDIGEIPLRDKSVSVTTSSHALEPNRGTLKELLLELFRVTRDKLVLFEPCYELASAEGKRRMDRLGYIRGVPEGVQGLGGRVVEQCALTNVDNPLNPTACFVIEPPRVGESKAPAAAFSVPGTDYPLVGMDGFLVSHDLGLCFPTIRGVPVLRSGAAIVASALARDPAVPSRPGT